MAESIEVRAKRGYDAYGGYVDWKNYAGLPMPKWEELPEKIRGAWIHATGVVIVEEDDSKTPSFADFREVFDRLSVLLTGTTDAFRDVQDEIANTWSWWRAPSAEADLVQSFRARHPDYPQPAVDDAVRGEINALARAWAAHSHSEPVFNLAGEGMKHGVYDHFKGGVYLSMGVSEWASGNCEPVVEYLSLTYGRKFTRFAHEWQSMVRWPDGNYRSRFVYRGPNLNTPEPPFKVRKAA